MDIREKVNLGAEVRDLYGARIREQLASGEIKPLVMPYSLLGVFILPILYLSIPHVKRPWLYRARFPLMAFIVAFSLNELAAGCTSENFAAAYAVGLTHSWGIVWSATLLIWMRPQFEAERVERRRRRSPRGGETNGSAHERNNSALRSETEQLQGAAPDEDVARYIKDYEYYWQAFPADEPFLTRLGWATDLVLSFRGTGWNWCIPVIPRFDKPEKPLSGELVKLDSIPICTPAGYRRATTRKEFIRARLHSMATSFLILDLCSVLMMKDPYNILGPTTHPLPPFLAALPPLALTCLRRTLGLASCFFALKLVFSLWQLVACLLLGGPLASVRGELWHYPSINGSPSAVLDRGLAGFWGAWWHQTFRAAFAAPAARLGIGSPGSPPASRAAAALLAFAASGALHAAGSHAEAGPTRPWAPPLFFLACWAGAVAQERLCGLLRAPIARVPGRWRRAGNLLLTVAWLTAASGPFLDDLARGGLWVYEPVPFSPLRALGLGKAGDAFWRWDAPYYPYWYTGRRWWLSGIAL